MNQTPEDPQGPDTGHGGDTAHPTHAPGDSPPTDDSFTLTPLDEVPTGRRFPSVGRLVAVTVVVLAMIGGAAFALGGNEEEPNDEGVASIDGTEGEVRDDGSSGNGASGPADDSEVFDAMVKFAECMREHGIDMPDPERDGEGIRMRAGDEAGPGGDRNEEEFEAAHEACEHFMEDARKNMPVPSPEEQAEMQDKLVAMAECMRARGYDMPDPEVAEDGGVRMRMHGGPDGRPQDDEQMEKDQEECNAEAGLDEDPRGGGSKGES
jgi:hypothetical protein